MSLASTPRPTLTKLRKIGLTPKQHDAVALVIRAAENDALERAATLMADVFGGDEAEAIRKLKHVR